MITKRNTTLASEQAIPTASRPEPQQRPRLPRRNAPVFIVTCQPWASTCFSQVSCSQPDVSDVDVAVLVGNFFGRGANHGAPVFFNIDVVLHYWVCSQTVWAHGGGSRECPPALGKCVPWDGPVRAGKSVAWKLSTPKMVFWWNSMAIGLHSFVAP